MYHSYYVFLQDSVYSAYLGMCVCVRGRGGGLLLSILSRHWEGELHIMFLYFFGVFIMFFLHSYMVVMVYRYILFASPSSYAIVCAGKVE